MNERPVSEIIDIIRVADLQRHFTARSHLRSPTSGSTVDRSIIDRLFLQRGVPLPMPRKRPFGGHRSEQLLGTIGVEEMPVRLVTDSPTASL